MALALPVKSLLASAWNMRYSGLGERKRLLLEKTWAILVGEVLARWLRISSAETIDIFYIVLVNKIILRGIYKIKAS